MTEIAYDRCVDGAFGARIAAFILRLDERQSRNALLTEGSIAAFDTCLWAALT